MSQDKQKKQEMSTQQMQQLLLQHDTIINLLTQMMLQESNRAQFLYPLGSKEADKADCKHSDAVDLENGVYQCRQCMAFVPYNLLAPDGKHS